MSNQKTLSPVAPSRSAEACMNVAEKAFESYGHSFFSSSDIASVAELSATSGTFKGLFSDMKQYGLIEKKDAGTFCIAQIVKDYTAAKEYDEKQAAALRYEIACRPSFFQKLIDASGGKIPEVTPLSNILISQYHFNKAKAQSTAKALSESLEWAQALDAKRNLVPPRGNDGARKESCTDCTPEAREVTPKATHCAEPTSTPHMNTAQLKMQLALTDGRIVEVFYPQDITEAEANMVSAVLAAIASGR